MRGADAALSQGGLCPGHLRGAAHERAAHERAICLILERSFVANGIGAALR